MKEAGTALLFAIANLAHPRILWLMVWPVLLAIALWGGLAWFFWDSLAVWLGEQIRGWMEMVTFFIRWDASAAALFAAKALILVLLVPLIQLTAVLILGIFGMQAMVDHVAERRFPALERRHGGSFGGSVWNGVLALAGLAALATLSLPLWLFPPLWPLIPVAILGWVNQRVLRYDALAEHADGLEMRRIFRERRTMLYFLGAALALIAYVPLAGFVAPVVAGLAFIHYLLGGLAAVREPPRGK
ncbi:MAG TPA: EI24 domain-containing protein [Burkholderiales bacterium]|nr:EI24 domain-containing protein [Burkholderiales bacterium]